MYGDSEPFVSFRFRRPSSRHVFLFHSSLARAARHHYNIFIIILNRSLENYNILSFTKSRWFSVDLTITDTIYYIKSITPSPNVHTEFCRAF